MNSANHVIGITAGIVFIVLAARETLPGQTSAAYRDLTHASIVFGREKSYRLYLPQGYDESDKRYPVVYFFHGWGGRHFKDDSARLEYEKLKALVDKFQIIMVMWDGNIDEKEPRPYNVGAHEDVKFQVQMCDYFQELAAHIDSHYRTLKERNQRGIIGFSMGGFISFFLAGKFPDMVVSAVSMAGSPEFFVGHPEDHTLYPVRYTFRNLQGVNVRMQSGDSDILFYLNKEVHEGALWEGIPLDYWQFHGGHMVDKPGETKAFESALKFTFDAFHRDNPPPKNWTHYDLYPDFDVWGYHVESDKREPGFIVLGDVDKSGFAIHTRRWLPDGPPLGDLHISVQTPALYAHQQKYRVVSFRISSGTVSESQVLSGADGRLRFDTDASGSQIGVFRGEDPPAFVCLDYRVGKEGRFLSVAKENKLIVRLFNRGGEKFLPQTIRAVVVSGDSAATVVESSVSVMALPGQRVLTLPALTVSCSKPPPAHAEPAGVKFTVSVYADSTVHMSDLTVPVGFDVPFFGNTRIDDGVPLREKAWGRGNKDGIPDAGERIMVYEGDHRLRLYTDDPWVLNADEQIADEILPAIWPDGYTLSSVIHISPDCPEGHQIVCLASYETKSYNPIERNVTWGKVRISVRHR
jgi:enterochelin esterase-like enzyme